MFCHCTQRVNQISLDIKRFQALLSGAGIMPQLAEDCERRNTLYTVRETQPYYSVTTLYQHLCDSNPTDYYALLQVLKGGYSDIAGNILWSTFHINMYKSWSKSEEGKMGIPCQCPIVFTAGSWWDSMLLLIPPSLWQYAIYNVSKCSDSACEHVVISDQSLLKLHFQHLSHSNIVTNPTFDSKV